MLRARGGECEILLVDDASTDRTAVLAAELLPATPGLKLLATEGRHGLGAALRVGLAAATLPLVACVPCDPAYPPAALKEYLAQIDKVHLVTGFRAGRPVPLGVRVLGMLVRLVTRVAFTAAPRRLPGWLGWRGHLAEWLVRLGFGGRLRDVGCPFFLCRRAILARAPLQSDGDFAIAELLAKLNFAGRYFPDEEVVLPVKAGQVPLTRRRLRQIIRDASRVFARPDFGPPKLPEDAAAAPGVTAGG